jgi:hypothetical protein
MADSWSRAGTGRDTMSPATDQDSLYTADYGGSRGSYRAPAEDLRYPRDSYREPVEDSKDQDARDTRESTPPSSEYRHSGSKMAESYTTESHAAVDTESIIVSGDRRLVIAFDFGTTFTGAALATPVDNSTELDDIVLVTKWSDRMKNQDKVPSVISYSKSPYGEQQWGSDISADALCMVHTKLELGIDTTSNELDLLLKTMEGVNGLSFSHLKAVAPIPDFPTQLPQQIVADYIEKAFIAIINFIEKQYTAAFFQTTPVDIVMTMPAVCLASEALMRWN